MRTLSSSLLLGAAALATSLSLVSCTKKVVITEYPIKQARFAEAIPCGEFDAHAASAHAGPPQPSRYWSAYLYIDPTNIVREWDTNSQSHIFISAKVELPTINGSITREFPLFTIEQGVVQQHAGVDILQRVPISLDSRQQTSIQLKVKYLANAEAAETVKQILAIATQFAQPLLQSYPAASQILSTASATIDQLTKEKPNRPQNTLTKYIIAEDLLIEGPGQQTTFAFLLPTHETLTKDAKDASSDWAKRFAKGLTTCTDKPFALCLLDTPEAAVGEHCYQEQALEVPYITITMRPSEHVYDPAVLLSAESYGCDLVTEAAIASAADYLAANRSLFHPDDIIQIESNLSLARRFLDAHPLVHNGDVSGLFEFLARNPDPSYEPYVTQGLCMTRQECEDAGTPADACRPMCSSLSADAWALWQCNVDLWNQIPATYVRKLYEQTSETDGKTNTELSIFGHVLSTVFAQLGRTDLDFGASTFEAKTLSELEDYVFAETPALAQYYWRYRGLQQSVLRKNEDVDAKALCADPAAVADESVTLYCDECNAKLAAKAKACQAQWDAAATAKRKQLYQLVDDEVESRISADRAPADAGDADDSTNPSGGGATIDAGG